MTIDEAIKKCCEEATRQESVANGAERLGVSRESIEHCKQCAADHRQLAEWLTELKELRNSVGAVKLSNMKEALKLIRAYKAENIAQKKLIAEYKRLLKAAVEDMNDGGCTRSCSTCKYGRDGCKYTEGYEWIHTDEALKLIES